MVFLINFIHILASALIICIIADILLSYFMSPSHPVRSTLDRIVQPLLDPIRRVVPTVGMLDFSPLVLLIIIQLVEWLLTAILARML